MEAVIKNGLVLQEDFSFVKQDLVIDGKKIVGSDSGHAKGFDRIDAKGRLILPGLINAHVHMALGLARGLGEGIPLVKMFEKILFPLEERLTDQQAYLGAMLCGIEFIESGCTEVNNIGKTWSEPVKKALEELGLRGTMALALKDVSLKSKEKMECEYLRENERLVKDLRNHPRLRGLFGLANEVEASQELIQEVKFLSKRYSTGVHVHVAETIMEKGFILRKTGKSSVAYLQELGVLTPETIAVHAVNVSSKDIDLLAKSGATVVHCPTANLALGAGVAPIKEMIEKGVRLGIGVDDPVATTNNSIIQEMANAIMLQKTRDFDLSYKKVLSMATQGITLSPGSKADLILVNPGKSLGEDFLGELIRGRVPVEGVIVDGEPLLLNGKFTRLDKDKLLEKALEARKDLSVDFL